MRSAAARSGAARTPARSALAGDTTAIVGFDASDRLTAWRTSNGESLWSSEAFQHRKLAAPLVTGQVVVFGDLEGLCALPRPQHRQAASCA